VPLHKLKGEKRVTHDEPIDRVRQRSDGRWETLTRHAELWTPIDVADDGTVEVQA